MAHSNEQHRYDNAEDLYTELNRIGIQHGEVGEHDEAISYFDVAIIMEPDLCSAYNNRGLSYYKKGDYQKAVDDYSKAIEISPDIAVFHTNRGIVHFRQRMYKEAVRDLNRAIQLDRNDAEAFNFRGEVLMAIGHPMLAEYDFEKANSINPNDTDAQANLLLAQAGQGSDDIIGANNTKIHWQIVDSIPRGSGHGIELYWLPEDKRTNPILVAFIIGFDWYHGKSGEAWVKYLDPDNICSSLGMNEGEYVSFIKGLIDPLVQAQILPTVIDQKFHGRFMYHING